MFLVKLVVSLSQTWAKFQPNGHVLPVKIFNLTNLKKFYLQYKELNSKIVVPTIGLEKWIFILVSVLQLTAKSVVDAHCDYKDKFLCVLLHNKSSMRR